MVRLVYPWRAPHEPTPRHRTGQRRRETVAAMAGASAPGRLPSWLDRQADEFDRRFGGGDAVDGDSSHEHSRGDQHAGGGDAFDDLWEGLEVGGKAVDDRWQLENDNV